MKKRTALIILTAIIFIMLLSQLSYAHSTSLLADFVRDPLAMIRAARSVKMTDGPVQGEWHENYKTVAHALGGVDGNYEINSYESFIESYERGFRVFEADLYLTSDHQLVVRHDFELNSYYNLDQIMDKDNPVMSHEKFMATPIRDKYSPLDADGIVALLNKYNDAYLITDTKFTDTANVTVQFNRLCEAIEKAGNDELYDRIIVQIYNDEMYYTVKNIHEFGGWIYTLYQLPERNFERIGRFCAHNGIDVVTMSEEIYSEKSIETLHSHGCKVYLHTVNDIKVIQKMSEGGADGFYTDKITQEELDKALGE